MHRRRRQPFFLSDIWRIRISFDDCCCNHFRPPFSNRTCCSHCRCQDQPKPRVETGPCRGKYPLLKSTFPLSHFCRLINIAGNLAETFFYFMGFGSRQSNVILKEVETDCYINVVKRKHARGTTLKKEFFFAIPTRTVVRSSNYRSPATSVSHAILAMLTETVM